MKPPILVDNFGNPHEGVPQCNNCVYFRNRNNRHYLFLNPYQCLKFYQLNGEYFNMADARNSDRLCGPEGKHFEPKPDSRETPPRKSFLKRIFSK